MAEQKETVKLKLQGKVFACTVCGTEDFFRRTVIVKEPNTSLFHPSASNEEAICLICSNCGYMHHFLPRLTKPDSAEQ